MSHSTCSVDACEGVTGIPGTARGYCSKHYNRWRRHGDPLAIVKRVVTLTCTLPDCEKPHDARGLCSAHLTNLRRHGMAAPRKKGSVVNGCKICADCAKDLPVTDFYTAGASPQPRCKQCAAIRARQYRESRIDLVREQARRSAAKRPLARRDAARKRRAAVRAASVENVQSMTVFDRDAWICGICNESIPRVTIWPHPQSPSLDHAVPISMGGAHSYSNTQASHLACNMSKGARAA